MHNAAITAKTGWFHGSVEFKHQNISVAGSVGDAVDSRIQAAAQLPERPVRCNRWVLVEEPRYPGHRADTDPGAVGPGRCFPPPAAAPPDPDPDSLRRLLRKFDPVERDHRNRALGKAGEQFVLNIERQHLMKAEKPGLAKEVRWVAAEEGDGAGYDILSFDLEDRPRLPEVKTTNGSARTPFFLPGTRARRGNRAAHRLVNLPSSPVFKRASNLYDRAAPGEVSKPKSGGLARSFF